MQVITGKMGTLISHVGNAYAAWFPPARKFVLFKYPAGEVLLKLMQDDDTDSIRDWLITETGAAGSEAVRFIESMKSELVQLLEPDQNTSPGPAYIQQAFFSPKVVDEIIIQLNYVSIQLVFNNHYLADIFIPLLRHLEVEGATVFDHRIEIFEQESMFNYRVNGESREHFSKDESSFLKGAVFKALASLAYHIPDEGWMATLHASAVSDGKSTLVFSSASGKGKSTLAALLQTQAYQIISDDFILLDNLHFTAWHLPMAISVKEGATEVLQSAYPDIYTLPEQAGSRGQKVRYLPPEENKWLSPSFPVKQLVFVHFDPDTDFKAERVDPGEALRQLLAESWVQATSENVRLFFGWFNTISCWNLHYSDINPVYRFVKELFSK